MQLCLFFLGRRIAGTYAGWFAMLLPVATHTFFYASEGRPYGLLLGLYAASLLCWLKASGTPDASPSRVSSEAPFTAPLPHANSHSQPELERHRLLALLGLTLSIALAITSHFFGLLILVPVAIGELTRTLTRRRLDWPVLSALILGAASILAILPTKRAVMIYKLHYYTSNPNLRSITLAYRRIFIEYPASWSTRTQGTFLILLTLTMAVLFYAAYRQLRPQPRSLQKSAQPAIALHETAAILALAALPFFGFVLGRFVTHSFETRYVNPALIGLTLITVLALKPLWNRPTVASALVLAAVFASAVENIQTVSANLGERRTFLSGYTAQPALPASSTEPVYLNDMGFFVQHWYYADPSLRERLTYVDSQQQEIAFLQHDVHFLTAIYMARFTPLHVISYEDFSAAAQVHPNLTVLYRTSWEWLARDLNTRPATLTPLGPYLGGQATEVTLPKSNP